MNHPNNKYFIPNIILTLKNFPYYELHGNLRGENIFLTTKFSFRNTKTSGLLFVFSYLSRDINYYLITIKNDVLTLEY